MASSFEGRVICFTGGLDMKRVDATAAAEALGAQVKSSITKAVDLVVAGNKAGAKLKKAEEAGLEIWSEGFFVHKLEEAEQRMAEKANETARQQLAKRKGKASPKSRSRSRPRKSKGASKEDELAWMPAWMRPYFPLPFPSVFEVASGTLDAPAYNTWVFVAAIMVVICAIAEQVRLFV